MKQPAKRTVLFLSLLSFIVLPGCWDKREIEQIGMITGIGLDQGEDSTDHRIKMTQQFVNTTIGSKEGVVKGYYNLTDEGSNIFEIVRRTSTRTDRSPYYTHLKVIILSDKITSTSQLMDLINFFQRDHEMRRTVRVYFSKGPASTILEKTTENKEIPAFNIFYKSRNHYKTLEMPRQLTLGEMSVYLSSQQSFLVQVIGLINGSEMQGAAIVSGKKKRLIGWLNREEVSGINWILGTKSGSKGGIITIIDKKTKKDIIYEVDHIATKIKPKVEGEQITFHVSIDSEGRLGEDWTVNDAFDEDFIKKTDEQIAEEVKRIVEQSIAKIKDTYKADVAGFGEQFRIKNYKEWKKVKDDWDDAFSRSNVEVVAKVHIREFGSKGRKVPKIPKT
ncbi:Ger(x)C family spore germination protein [Paenibacillus anseongense]|uniref:Ger(x)C family spore germination protein n=1 Tax=Paenibacillus anseongense TaxID=2682845 RepID=UPI002DC01B74|nr:Ger(x)C family spore germination protein [Paenibacillus anseongense]MEC0269939.1 Ger(x)C family spore germination protein [Paenibacillus anseongense]